MWLEPTIYRTRGEHANYYTTVGLDITCITNTEDIHYIGDLL